MKYNFINDTIKIDFAIPEGIQEMMDLAEKADLENNLPGYINYADTIDVMMKNGYAHGDFTEKQWNLVCARYTQS